MKKYLLLFLLLLSINSYSQDTTRQAAAKEAWLSDPNNYNQGQPMPTWDLDGNIIPIVGIVLLFGIVLKRKSKFVYI